MTQEEKQLLMRDLCARVPYKIKCLVNFSDGTKDIMTLTELPNSFGNWGFSNKSYSGCSDNFKPYLRPMSSMTEEEKNEYFGRTMTIDIVETSQQVIDWLLKHHFDYRGLIEKGLALEAKEGMYKTE